MVCVVMIAGRGEGGGTVSDGVERWRKTRPQVELCVGGGSWARGECREFPNPVPISKDHLLTYNVI